MQLEIYYKLESQLATRFRFKLDTLFKEYNENKSYDISLKLNEPFDSLYEIFLNDVFNAFKEETKIKYSIKSIYAVDPQKLYTIVNIVPENNISNEKTVI